MEISKNLKYTAGSFIFFGFIWLIPIIFVFSSNEITSSLIAFLSLLSLTFFISGIGLFFGKKWAWWISTVYMFLLSSLFIAGMIIEPAKINPASLIFLALASNLFSQDIIQYCGLSQVSTKKRIIIPLSITIPFFIITILYNNI